MSSTIPFTGRVARSEEHTSELQSHSDIVCRLLLEKKKDQQRQHGEPSGEHPGHLGERRSEGVQCCSQLRFVRAHEAIFFFNDTATTEIYTLSLHDALPISAA